MSKWSRVSSDTGRGLGESPEEDLVHAQNLHLREKMPTQRQLPITPRKKYDGHTPHPAPGPGLHQDPALVRVLGPDPGLDASQADARIVPAPPIICICQMHQSWFICQQMFILT